MMIGGLAEVVQMLFGDFLRQSASFRVWLSYWRAGRVMVHYVWYTNEAGGSVEVPCETLREALAKWDDFARNCPFREGGIIAKFESRIEA
jgi:hypothetical protein